jgi:phenylacetate-CoA ligase
MSEQLRKLQALLAALSSNSFYSGVSANIASLDEFFARTPLTSKKDLAADQLAHPPFGSNLTYPIDRYTRINQTSGTSGSPLYWLDTPESWEWMLDTWTHVYRSAGITAGDRIFFAFSFGMFLGFWTAYESAARLGCLRMPGGGMSSVARLRTMLDTGATVLCCTPTYALRLAEVAAEQGIDLAGSKIRRIIVAGEPGRKHSARPRPHRITVARRQCRGPSWNDGDGSGQLWMPAAAGSAARGRCGVYRRGDRSG